MVLGRFIPVGCFCFLVLFGAGGGRWTFSPFGYLYPLGFEWSFQCGSFLILGSRISSLEGFRISSVEPNRNYI